MNCSSISLKKSETYLYLHWQPDPKLESIDDNEAVDEDPDKKDGIDGSGDIDVDDSDLGCFIDVLMLGRK